MTRSKSYEQSCPIARTLDVLGDRWTILILRDLFFGRSKFSELVAQSPGIPPKVLSDRLKRLTGAGYVERVIYSEHPLRAEYRLTEKGLSFFPVMESIMEWGLGQFYADEADIQTAVREQVAAAAQRYPQLRRRRAARSGS